MVQTTYAPQGRLYHETIYFLYINCTYQSAYASLRTLTSAKKYDWSIKSITKTIPKGAVHKNNSPARYLYAGTLYQQFYER